MILVKRELFAMFVIVLCVSVLVGASAIPAKHPCLATSATEGDHCGLWAANNETGEMAVVTATKHSGTFVGIYSKDEAGRQSLTIALTERGIVFRDALGKQQTLTIEQLNLLRMGAE